MIYFPYLSHVSGKKLEVFFFFPSEVGIYNLGDISFTVCLKTNKQYLNAYSWEVWQFPWKQIWNEQKNG